MISLSYSTITGDNGLGHAAKNCRGQPDRVGCNLCIKDCVEKTVANRINNMCLSNLRVDENTVMCRKDVRHLSPWGWRKNLPLAIRVVPDKAVTNIRPIGGGAR